MEAHQRIQQLHQDGYSALIEKVRSHLVATETSDAADYSVVDPPKFLLAVEKTLKILEDRWRSGIRTKCQRLPCNDKHDLINFKMSDQFIVTRTKDQKSLFIWEKASCLLEVELANSENQDAATSDPEANSPLKFFGYHVEDTIAHSFLVYGLSDGRIQFYNLHLKEKTSSIETLLGWEIMDVNYGHGFLVVTAKQPPKNVGFLTHVVWRIRDPTTSSMSSVEVARIETSLSLGPPINCYVPFTFLDHRYLVTLSLRKTDVRSAKMTSYDVRSINPEDGMTPLHFLHSIAIENSEQIHYGSGFLVFACSAELEENQCVHIYDVQTGLVKNSKIKAPKADFRTILNMEPSLVGINSKFIVIVVQGQRDYNSKLKFCQFHLIDLNSAITSQPISGVIPGFTIPGRLTFFKMNELEILAVTRGSTTIPKIPKQQSFFRMNFCYTCVICNVIDDQDVKCSHCNKITYCSQRCLEKDVSHMERCGTQ